MKPLEPTPELLLDYLYGLLDDEQQRQVDRLVQSEPQWSAALDRARGHQTILAAAAKSSFPDVRFEPPKPRTEIRSAEATQVFQMPARRSGLRYALAALGSAEV